MKYNFYVRYNDKVDLETFLDIFNVSSFKEWGSDKFNSHSFDHEMECNKGLAHCIKNTLNNINGVKEVKLTMKRQKKATRARSIWR